jgi:hypothetical protein
MEYSSSSLALQPPDPVRSGITCVYKGLHTGAHTGVYSGLQQEHGRVNNPEWCVYSDDICSGQHGAALDCTVLCHQMVALSSSDNCKGGGGNLVEADQSRP